MFYLLEVVSRFRDPQLQVGIKLSYLYNFNQTVFQSCKCNVNFSDRLLFFEEQTEG